MPEMRSYPHGVPSWIDLVSPDVDASKAFYTSLFGWQASTVPTPEAGGHTLFTMNGKRIAGVGPIMWPDQPPQWLMYVSVSDADSTARKTVDAGGTVLVEPTDVTDLGRVAVIADTSGAAVGLLQPGALTGAQLVSEPGSYHVSELATHHTEAAKAFYAAVFGWETSKASTGPREYTQFKVGGKTIDGMFEIGDTMPADTPSHWGVYLAVADCDATVATAARLGATVVAPPEDRHNVGRFAVLSDPQGAVVRVIQLSAGPGA